MMKCPIMLKVAMVGLLRNRKVIQSVIKPVISMAKKPKVITRALTPIKNLAAKPSLKKGIDYLKVNKKPLALGAGFGIGIGGFNSRRN